MLDRVPPRVAAGQGRVALPPEIAFLIGDVAEDALVAAAARAGRIGTAAQDELVASNAISAKDYARLLARHTGLDAASAVAPWHDNAAACCPRLPIRAGLVAVRNGNRGVAVAALPQGQMARRLIEKSAGLSALIPPVVVAPPQTFHDALIARHGRDILRAAIEDLENVFPNASARSGSAVWQRSALAALVVGGLAGLVTAPAVAMLVLLGVVSVFFLGVSILRLVAVSAAATQPTRGVDIKLSDADLPVYTVLVPLYGEANMVAPLLAALDRIDYPRAKLDIKLIVEADDVDTQAALRGRDLRAGYEIVTVPQGQPKTKPRALNFALKLARGTLVTIFDAEDWPQPSQLRHAAAVFRDSPPDVACLQARLAWYNWADNWLTRGIMAQTPPDLAV